MNCSLNKLGLAYQSFIRCTDNSFKPVSYRPTSPVFIAERCRWTSGYERCLLINLFHAKPTLFGCTLGINNAYWSTRNPLSEHTDIKVITIPNNIWLLQSAILLRLTLRTNQLTPVHWLVDSKPAQLPSLHPTYASTLTCQCRQLPNYRLVDEIVVGARKPNSKFGTKQNW